jgi:hypothetical protein
MPWILFGGLQGELLSRLTMVSVSRSTFGTLHSIRFHYIDGLPDVALQLEPRPIWEGGDIERFPIDGKGGETITTFSTFVSIRNKLIPSFEIETNRHRTATFGQDKRRGYPRPLGMRPNHTLVGIYVVQVCGMYCALVPAQVLTRRQDPESEIIGVGAIGAYKTGLQTISFA